MYLLVLGAVFGCGNSSDEYVYTGAAPAGARVSGANQVLLSVTVPANVTGAQPLGAIQNGSTVRTLAAKSESPPTGDYTLPGALCRAYDILGQPVSTVVVSAEGTVRFDTLPPGVYRFVVTNQDQAVLLETIASASPHGPTLIDANTSSTAAVLVTLSAGKGRYDLKTYSHALAVDLSQLIGMVEAQVANPNDPWITPDGKTVVDPVVRQVVEDSVRALPGKGKYVRGDATPEGYGEPLSPGAEGAGSPLPRISGTPSGDAAPDETMPGSPSSEFADPSSAQPASDPEAYSEEAGDGSSQPEPTPAPQGELPDPMPPQDESPSAQGPSQ